MKHLIHMAYVIAVLQALYAVSIIYLTIHDVYKVVRNLTYTNLAIEE